MTSAEIRSMADKLLALGALDPDPQWQSWIWNAAKRLEWHAMQADIDEALIKGAS